MLRLGSVNKSSSMLCQTCDTAEVEKMWHAYLGLSTTRRRELQLLPLPFALATCKNFKFDDPYNENGILHGQGRQGAGELPVVRILLGGPSSFLLSSTEGISNSEERALSALGR
jgi:hypothetical protein